MERTKLISRLWMKLICQTLSLKRSFVAMRNRMNYRLVERVARMCAENCGGD